MRKLPFGVIFLCTASLFAAAPAVSFFQQPTTEKKSGTTSESAGQPANVTPGGGVQGTRSGSQRSPASSSGQQGTAAQKTAQQTAPRQAAPIGVPGAEPVGSVTPESTGSAGGGAGVKLSFSGASIDRVIHSVMQELGYSYVIDPQVQGTVNIFTMREIPRDKLFGVLEQLLKMNGQAIVKQDDFYVIVPIGQSPTIPHEVLVKQVRRPEPEASQEGGEKEEEGSAETEPTEAPAPVQPVGEENEETQGVSSESSLEGEGIVTFIIPLHYIPSEQMLQMAQAFISPGATVVDFAPANMLILTDYRKNVRQILNLVELLDTRYFEVNSVELVPIKFNQAVDVAEDLGQVFAPGDTAAGVRIVAIERLNSILVVTRSPDVYKEVAKWIAKLDAPSSTSNMKTFVYQVENATAVQIAQILGELYQDGLGLPSSATGDVAEGQTGGTGLQGRQPGRSAASQRNPTQAAGFVGNAQGGFDQRGFGTGNLGMRELGPALSQNSQSQIRAIVAGNVKIVVNEFNNSLIIQGTESDIQFILETVRQLDVLPRQVFIEARIFSVELRDDLSYGVGAFLQARGSSLPGAGSDGGEAAIDPATVGSIDDSGALSAVSRIAIGAERELQLVLNALREKTRVEVIEAPRILALDGTAASINVGAEVPVTSASFGNPLTSGTTNFVNSIQFRPTGTTLLIVPRISASGIVNMDLVLEISQATGPALTPTINRNYVQTSLIVRDGQTVGLGGIMSDSDSDGKKRVPLLGDIPIIGALFGQTTSNERRFELVIFITPHVIRSLPTAAELTLDFKRSLKFAYEYIEKKNSEEKDLKDLRREQELRNQP